MIPMSLAEIAEVTGGVIHGPEGSAEIVVDGPVVTDSRQCGPGGLYVARIGEHADGHDFAGSAAAAGAVAALATRPLEELPCVVVGGDVQDAFSALATALVRAVDGLTVIGITGSSGKTTTKDLLASVLSAYAPTVANVGSLNSEVGVPLTVCRITEQTRFLIVEMGARGVGHIRYLTDMVTPSIGLVLNVGSAHVGEFGSQEAIASAKAELVEALPSDGLAVLNADDPLVAAMASRTSARVLTFSVESEAGEVCAVEKCTAEVCADGVEMAGGRARFDLRTPTGSAHVALQLLGRHNVANALAVAAVSTAVGMSAEATATALSGARPQSRYRMEITDRSDGITIVNDAYNANPESMAAALRSLPEVASGRRTWFVVGEMRELGEASAAEHARVGRLAEEAGVDHLLAVGADVASWIADGTDDLEVACAADLEAARLHLHAQLEPGDVVLVKASNGTRLWSLPESLPDPLPSRKDATR